MRVYYDQQNRQLIYINKAANSDFWDETWGTLNFKNLMENSKDDKFILNLLEKYLPDKKGVILEGGCGRGHYVYCMHNHGYQVIGIDFAEKTVKKITEIHPELDVREGDVRNLSIKNDTLSAYWSLGVIEHFWEGYSDIIEEMSRVVKDDGYLFLSFPYMSPLRKFKSKIGLYKEFNGNKKDFYQYALDSNKVIYDLERFGFHLLEKTPLNGIKGFKDEIGLLKPIMKSFYYLRSLEHRLYGTPIIFNFFDKLLSYSGSGHVVLLVFKKI